MPTEIKKETVSRKTFKYSSNGVSLDFSLRVDVENELVDFAAILEKAREDVLAEHGDFIKRSGN